MFFKNIIIKSNYFLLSISLKDIKLFFIIGEKCGDIYPFYKMRLLEWQHWYFNWNEIIMLWLNLLVITQICFNDNKKTKHNFNKQETW